ncbi:MAG: hypothetical protein JST82_08665 [Bacteroidetes bacterium]|nr:hypothetical protein [Bacteroidota bacterium]
MELLYKQYLITIQSEDINANQTTAGYLNTIEDVSDSIQYRPSTSIGIRISKEGKELTSVLINGFCGATRASIDNVLIHNDSLLLCVSNNIHKLKLPTLELIWSSRCDDITCFSIHSYRGDYIIHGESQITRLSHDGLKKWYFSARDIFINLSSDNTLRIVDDIISVKDFEGYTYFLDENGTVLKEQYDG